jgi:anaerobic magnesium-protoporphyrin IX monomethyl ester cyclase
MAIVECCNQLSKGNGLEGIPNILTKGKKIPGSVQISPPIDLDSLPYTDFTIYDRRAFLRAKDGRRYITANVELDRGCPYSCSFCSAPSLRTVYREHGNCYYRRKSPERIVRELANMCEKIRPEYVNLCSETLLARPLEELKALAELYVKDIGLPFWCQTRPETVTEEKVSVLSWMGCHHIQMGIESGNEAFRKNILNRCYTNKRVLDACKAFRKAGLRFTTNNMIGLPGETREMIFDTIQLNRSVRPYNVKVYMFSPYYGTALHDYCLKNGYLNRDLCFGRFSNGVELNGQPLTMDQYRGLHRTFPLYVTLPRKEFDRIQVAERIDTKGDQMFKELKEEYLDGFFQDEGRTLGGSEIAMETEI